MSTPAILSAETSAIMSRSVAERKAWIEQDHWVNTDTGDVSMKYMESLLFSHRRLRPRCMQIIAESGMGKSALLQTFASLHPVIKSEDPIRLQRPVLLANATVEGRGVGEFRASIMRAAWPDAYHSDFGCSAGDLDATLRAQDVRVILLDELGEVLKCGPSTHRRILGELRRITHDLHINVVAASVEGLSHALKQDPQLHSRFRIVIKIPAWTESQKFRNFVFGLEQFLPLPERSFLDSMRIVRWLLRYSKNTEDIVDFIQDAALYALDEDAPCVSLDHFKQARKTIGPPPITLKHCA